MRYRIKVDKLCTGLYVAELDCPWAGTPFLFQGFLIESDEDLAQLRSTCTFVIVDEAQSRVPAAELAEPEEGAKLSATENVPASGPKLSLRDATHLTAERAAAHINLHGLSAASARDGALAEKIKACEPVVQKLLRESSNSNLMLQQANLRTSEDRETRHALNTAVLAVAFGHHLGQPENQLRQLGMAALLHDVGKIDIPLQILKKSGGLTSEEFNIVKQHPAKGFDLLQTTGNLPTEILEAVRRHHERLDGSGYPDGLKDDAVPLHALVIALADTYETLTTPNPYALPLTPAEAVQRMRATGTSGFGQELLQQFMRFLGIYPIGSLVKLSNNEIAVVYASEPRQRLRPIIIIVQDGHGHPVYPHRLINLATLATDKLAIVEVVNPMQYRVIVPKVFEQELRKSV